MAEASAPTSAVERLEELARCTNMPHLQFPVEMSPTEAAEILFQLRQRGSVGREEIDDAALLPCPFCGSSDVEIVRATDEDGEFAAVGCNGCGAGSRQHYYLGDDAAEHARGAWNKRSLLPAPKPQPAPTVGREEVESALTALYHAGMRIGARTSRDLAADDIDAALPRCMDTLFSPTARADPGAGEEVDLDWLDELFARLPAGPWTPIQSTEGWEVRQVDTDPGNKHHWPTRLCQNISGQRAAFDDDAVNFIAAILNVWPTIRKQIATTPSPASTPSGDAVTSVQFVTSPQFEMVRRYAVICDMGDHKNVRCVVSLDGRDPYSTADLAVATRIATETREAGTANVRLIDACSGETLG